MNRDMIFKRIMELIKLDYVGYPEFEQRNESTQYMAALAKKWKDRELTDDIFGLYTTQYLLAMGDRNLKLVSLSDAYIPPATDFHVHSHDGLLYVIDASEDSAFRAGDVLLTLNRSKPTEHLEYVIGDIVNGAVEDRQLWDGLVTLSSHALVQHEDGTQEDLPIRHLREMSHPENRMEALDDGTVLLHVECFDDSAAELVRNGAETLAAASRLIVDVRHCAGGAPENLYPLLPYLFSEDTTLQQVVGPRRLYTLYTKDNCQMRVEQLRAFAQAQGLADDSWVKDEIAAWERKSGMGMLLEDAPADSLTIEAVGAPQRVILLTDVTCEDAGETLVSWCAASDKVTIVGRATMGTTEYLNPLTVAFDEDFAFTYPLSKTEAAASGTGITGVGILPDVVIDWTAAECHGDVILQRALRL